jgi:hypothetical protein
MAPNVLAPVCVAGGSSVTFLLQAASRTATKLITSIFFIDIFSGFKRIFSDFGILKAFQAAFH